MLLVFQYKDSFEIIGFWSMHFGFVLDLSDIDLLNVDLLDQRYTHLDLSVSKTSWRSLQDMSSKRLQDMSSRRRQDMSWRRLEDISCLEDVLEDEKLLRWIRVQDMSWRCLEHQQMFAAVCVYIFQFYSLHCILF